MEFSSGLIVFNRSRDIVLLEVGNCLISFLGSSTESVDLGVFVSFAFKVDFLEVKLLVIVYRIDLFLNLFL